MSNLKPCKSCGTEVSKTAEACPKCGAVLKQKTGCCGLIVIGLGVLFIGGIWISETPKSERKAWVEQKVAEIQATEREERKVVANATPTSSITFAELEPIFCAASEKTNLQKKEIWKQYDGKKVKWSGHVSAISDSLQMQVKMQQTTLTSDVLVKLNDSEKSKALKLKVGDAVTFTGVLVDWGTIMPYTLRDGEIVSDSVDSEATPKPNAPSARTTGTKTYGSNDFQEVVLKAANEGNPSAQTEIGNRYRFGKPHDYENAAIWYHKAAEQGDMTAAAYEAEARANSAAEREQQEEKNTIAMLSSIKVVACKELSTEILGFKLGEPILDFYKRMSSVGKDKITMEQVGHGNRLYMNFGKDELGNIGVYSGSCYPIECSGYSFGVGSENISNELVDKCDVVFIEGRATELCISFKKTTDDASREAMTKSIIVKLSKKDSSDAPKRNGSYHIVSEGANVQVIVECGFSVLWILYEDVIKAVDAENKAKAEQEIITPAPAKAATDI